LISEQGAHIAQFESEGKHRHEYKEVGWRRPASGKRNEETQGPWPFFS
jgi:hypothetical protein